MKFFSPRLLARFLSVLLVCSMVSASFGSVANARYISPDNWNPTLPGVGTNRYAYSLNDPVNKSDPNGHIVGAPDKTAEGFGFGGVLGGIVGAVVGALAGGVVGGPVGALAGGEAGFEGGVMMGAALGGTKGAMEDAKEDDNARDKKEKATQGIKVAGTPNPGDDDNNDKSPKTQQSRTIKADSRDFNRMDPKSLQKAAKNNGYNSVHEMKDDYDLDSKSDIFSDKSGNLYSGPTKGFKGEVDMEPLNMHVNGPGGY